MDLCRGAAFSSQWVSAMPRGVWLCPVAVGVWLCSDSAAVGFTCDSQSVRLAHCDSKSILARSLTVRASYGSAVMSSSLSNFVALPFVCYVRYCLMCDRIISWVYFMEWSILISLLQPRRFIMIITHFCVLCIAKTKGPQCTHYLGWVNHCCILWHHGIY